MGRSWLQAIGAAQCADVAQVGSDPGPFAVDAMTARTAAGSLEPCASAIGVAYRSAARVKGAHVADIGDDRGEFRRIKPEGRHGRARDAVGENVAQIDIRRCAPQRAAAQIHAADLRASLAVACGALCLVNLYAVANVLRGIG